MKRFCKVTALFLLPVFIIGIFFAALLFASGEAASVKSYVSRTAEDAPRLFELAYTYNNESTYKAHSAYLRTPEVLALGTSRIMQLRQEELPRADFYNAGGAVYSLGQMQSFLEYLPQKPKVVILCLDQFFFNGWDSYLGTKEPYQPPQYEFDFADAFIRILRDFSLGKINPVKILSAPDTIVGISARSRSSGFLPDGSYQYGTMADVPDLTFPAENKAITEGSDRFLYADAPNEEALQEVEEFLSYCQQQQIEVVAFLPPYAPSIYQRMEESGNYLFLETLPPALASLCDAYGAEFYDFTLVPDSEDAEFIDGYHGGDRVYARMVKQMLEDGSLLNKYSSPAEIDALLALEGGNPRVIQIP